MTRRRYIRRFGRVLLARSLGRSRFQGIFEAVYDIALAGMNVGTGTAPRGSGEDALLLLLAQENRDGCVRVFDVGAHSGAYTEAVLGKFGARAVVEAFEPSSAAFARLTVRYANAPNVRLHNLALGHEPARLELVSPVPGSRAGSLFDRSERLAWSNASRETVDVTTLDEHCNEAGVERIDILKVDTEGNELNVLRGARGLLDRGAIRVIQFEFSAANVESRTFLRDFFNVLGPRYRVYRLLRDGLRPVEYHERYELFAGATNYVAFRASCDSQPSIVKGTAAAAVEPSASAPSERP